MKMTKIKVEMKAEIKAEIKAEMEVVPLHIPRAMC